MLALLILLALALAAFLLLHDWEEEPDPRTMGGPHVLDDELRHVYKRDLEPAQEAGEDDG